jgi:diketogulonate reductase-like aldo/keto reductase
LRWLLQQNVAAIPRTSRIERLSENIEIFDFALSPEEMAQISQMGSPKGRLTDFGFAPKWD